MMNSQELKQAIVEDIETLKGLSLEIIPASDYYRGLLKLLKGGVFKLGLIAFFVLFYATVFNPTYENLKSDYIELAIKSAAIAFSMALCAMILLLTAITHYYLFRCHLENKLKTGPLLVKKMQQCAHLFLCVFFLLSFIVVNLIEPSFVLFSMPFIFLATSFIAYTAISMEINRIGIATFCMCINTFFNKDKTG